MTLNWECFCAIPPFQQLRRKFQVQLGIASYRACHLLSWIIYETRLLGCCFENCLLKTWKRLWVFRSSSM